MAKGIVQTAYGKAPDRSYLGGCSNGGRHALVAASRYADQYDGILSGDPGWRLPLAALANVAGYQTYVSLATTAGDPATGFTVAERQLVSSAVTAKCDALDGATDGLIQDTKACQAAFDVSRDVPTCTGARDGNCLSGAAEDGIAKRFSGATTSTGTKIYSSWPWATAWHDRLGPDLVVRRAAEPRLPARCRVHLAGAAGRPGHVQRHHVRR
jgi:feruloyl esterase